MPINSRLSLLLVGMALVLPGCSQQVNDIRADMFANNPQRGVTVKPSAVSVNLKATPAGQSFTTESLTRLNDVLNRQGRLNQQTLTLLPYNDSGEKIAQRLSRTLAERGVPTTQIVLRQDLRDMDGGPDSDLMVISEALVVQVPDCGIADPQAWAVSPYTAVGTLGCANRANLARMVSDPRDLLRPRTLAPGDGNHASAAVQRYHSDDIRDLADIDFDD